MRLVHRSSAVLVFALTCAAVFASTAIAAEPVTFERIDVTVLTEGSRNILVVTGELPDSTKLPADVELHLPAAKELQWAGEVLGEDMDQDLEVTPKVTRNGVADIYAFTLTKSLTGQIELIYPEVVRFDGESYSANLAYISPTPLKTLTLNVRIPESAKIVSAADGAELSPGYETYNFYHRTIEPVEAGTKHDLSFTFAAPGQTADASGTPRGAAEDDGSFATMLVMAFAVGAFLLAGRAIAKKARAKTAE